ncbi:MAG: hypothetical protein FJ004_04980 [Chloroflexi bacterium]|nr:hypothetical protein [Chloroflexota bacterium]
MKVKFSTMALILLFCVLFANVVMVYLYFHKQDEQALLSTELVEAQDTLSVSEGNITGLQEQKPAAEARLKEAQLAVAQARAKVEQYYSAKGLSEISILDSILELVLENRVEIVKISTKPVTVESDANHIYSALSVEMSVSGGLAEVASFVSELENRAIKVVAIDSITMSGVDGSYVASLTFSVFYLND